MNPISSNTSSADPEIQRQYAERQAAQQPQPVQGPRMVQGNPQQQEEDRDITHAADSDALPSQFRPEAGSDMRVVARSEAAAVTPLPAKPAVPVTFEALKFAAQQADPGEFMRMVEDGADIDAKDSLGKTLLMHAAGGGGVAVVAILLSLGAELRATDKEGYTALMAAGYGGYTEVMGLLFEAGRHIHGENAVFTEKPTEKTGLMYAAGGGGKAIVQKLLSLNVDVNVVDKHGMTALMYAAKHGELDILALLLKHGAHVNLRGMQVKNATVTAIEQENMPVLELLLDYGGEPYDLQGSPPLLVGDMLMHRALLKREVVAPPLTLESLNGISTAVPPELSANRAVHEELAQIFEGLQICSPITIEFNKQLFDSGKQMQALTGTGNPLSQAQKSIAIGGLLASLEGWVKSWTPGLTIYRGKGLSAQAEAKLTALVKLQVEKLVALGEQMEMTLATSLETLMPQCAQYTQVKNGELVVDDVGLMTHLTGQLGLYGPLADQVAAAWFTAVNQRQAVILSSSLFQSAFDEQASESEAGEALLTAFGQALKQIDSVAGGSLLRTSALQGEQAGLYADLMHRQLHMLMQYADQASAAS